MASMPAYRLDTVQAAPSRIPAPQQAPSIQVVPGGRSTQNPSLSPGLVLGLHIIVGVIIAFLVVGLLSTALSSAAMGVATQSSAVREDISEARAVQESLAVQKSASANPIALREQAATQLGMGAPAAIETVVLPADVVCYDAEGGLSLTDSVAQLEALS